jgi:hypothetical protein
LQEGNTGAFVAAAAAAIGLLQLITATAVPGAVLEMAVVSAEEAVVPVAGAAAPAALAVAVGLPKKHRYCLSMEATTLLPYSQLVLSPMI